MSVIFRPRPPSPALPSPLPTLNIRRQALTTTLTMPPSDKGVAPVRKPPKISLSSEAYADIWSSRASASSAPAAGLLRAKQNTAASSILGAIEVNL